MVVQHNLRAMNSNRMLGVTSSQQSKSTEKLSSGYKINRAADDAAGLSLSEQMRGQIRGLNQASDNAQNGVSLIQTAEGALNETHAILQRMRELAVQGANDTNVSKDRIAINKEMTQLQAEIGRIGSSTEFNTMKLLNGSFGDKKLQVGANKGAEQTSDIKMAKITSTQIKATGATTAVDISQIATKIASGAAATSGSGNTAYQDAIKIIDNAIEAISTSRSELGATQNRLEHTIANADNTSENLQAAESRIRDVDMADEMVKYSKSSILQQAGQSMLAQANQSTQGVLSLLR